VIEYVEHRTLLVKVRPDGRSTRRRLRGRQRRYRWDCSCGKRGDARFRSPSAAAANAYDHERGLIRGNRWH
jgi:hypothetical protein